ncbi:hypothetical protein Syun_018200 [Stephania yunnanensis]|uniref:Uncharacterized protein n=1 Tax=Stephania yunnanensis TaxID=152371 RepID=A0AAP0IRT5_9MAGN
MLERLYAKLKTYQSRLPTLNYGFPAIADMNLYFFGTGYQEINGVECWIQEQDQKTIIEHGVKNKSMIIKGLFLWYM